MATSSREQQTQQVYQTYRDFYAIGGGLVLVIIGIWIGSLLFGEGYDTKHQSD